MDVLDHSMLAQLRALPGADGGPLLDEVIDTFLAHLPGQLEAIGAALHAGDARATEQAAHALNGAAGALGAQRLAAACAMLEQKAEAGSPERSLLPDIESAAAEARAALDRERTR